jgi:hypothetical protein
MTVALKVPRSLIVPAVQLNGSFSVNLQVCLPHLKKNTLSRYERPTTSPLALIPKPRLTPSPRFPRSVMV